MNDTIDFEKATEEELLNRFNQMSEINDVLINLFHKAYSVSQTILTSDLSELAIKKQHHDFIEMLAMSQAVGDMMAKKKSVNEMIAFYLLGAKTQAEKILLNAETEAEQIVKKALVSGGIAEDESAKQEEIDKNRAYEELIVRTNRLNKPLVLSKPVADTLPRGKSKLAELKQELSAITIQLGGQVEAAIESINSFKV